MHKRLRYYELIKLHTRHIERLHDVITERIDMLENRLDDPDTSRTDYVATVNELDDMSGILDALSFPAKCGQHEWREVAKGFHTVERVTKCITCGEIA